MNDKAQHAIAGAASAALGLLVYTLASMLVLAVSGSTLPYAGLIPVPFIAALVAGLTKEAADWLDNRQYATDLHHTVDPWDVAATAAPGLVISIALAFTVM